GKGGVERVRPQLEPVGRSELDEVDVAAPVARVPRERDVDVTRRVGRDAAETQIIVVVQPGVPAGTSIGLVDVHDDLEWADRLVHPLVGGDLLGVAGDYDRVVGPTRHLLGGDG